MTTIIVPEKQTMYCMHGIVLPPVVFKLSEYIPVARVVAALQKYLDEFAVYSKEDIAYSDFWICPWLRLHAGSLGSGVTGALERALERALEHKADVRSLGGYVSAQLGLSSNTAAVNKLRVVWVEHCIKELNKFCDDLEEQS